MACWGEAQQDLIVLDKERGTIGKNILEDQEGRELVDGEGGGGGGDVGGWRERILPSYFSTNHHHHHRIPFPLLPPTIECRESLVK